MNYTLRNRRELEKNGIMLVPIGKLWWKIIRKADKRIMGYVPTYLEALNIANHILSSKNNNRKENYYAKR